MPRYFFHLIEKERRFPDEEGQIFEAPEAARKAAIKGARDMMAADVRHGVLDLDGRVDVADALDTLLFSVPFSSAVEITGPGK